MQGLTTVGLSRNDLRGVGNNSRPWGSVPLGVSRFFGLPGSCRLQPVTQNYLKKGGHRLRKNEYQILMWEFCHKSSNGKRCIVDLPEGLLKAKTGI